MTESTMREIFSTRPSSGSRRLAETVRKLLARHASSNVVHILNQLRPLEVAELLQHLPVYRGEAFEVLARANPSLAASTLHHLGASQSTPLLSQMSTEAVAAVMEQLDIREAAIHIQRLPPNLGYDVIAKMHLPEAVELQKLVPHAEKTAGRLMKPKVACQPESATVSDAIGWLQSSRGLDYVFYLYVVDDHRRLVGVLSLRQLLLQTPDTPLKAIMVKPVIQVSTEAAQEEVARLVSQYNLLAIPVVDEENVLVGVVTVDDVFDIIQKEAAEDMYRLVGLNSEDSVLSPARRSVRMRIPWLVVNLATAFLAAAVVSLFEGTIQRLALLAVFMPVVAGMGGNAASQTLTVMVRGIALGELRWSNTGKAVMKELLVGLANGLSIAAIVALVAFVWKGNALFGVVLAVAMLGNLVVAAAAGTIVPLVLRWLKIDPALASSVFVTTCTDACGFFFFLGLGQLLLERLV
jgi:magnesium transporter